MMENTVRKVILGFLSVLVLTAGISMAATGRVPDTGQTISHTDIFGEDHDYLINAPSYTKLDASGNDLADDATSWTMVRDDVTGLIWEVKTDDGSVHDKDNTYTLGDGTDTEDFINELNSSHYGGHSDWRMPTEDELGSIVDFSRENPAVNGSYFKNSKSSYYWSATANVKYSDYTWIVDFGSGIVTYANNLSIYYVRAVRGGEPMPLDHLVSNDDGTVTDTHTGLVWMSQKNDSSPGRKSWDGAINYCENLEYAEYSDWRLPSIKELASIVKKNTYNPSIDLTYFSAESTGYWSSTSSTNNSASAWRVDFYYGSDNSYDKSNIFYVRAVRAGQSKLPENLFISTPEQASFWVCGDIMAINWETRNIGGNVKISLSRDGGKNFTEIIANTPNDGSYDWTVTSPDSINCMLKIEPVEDASRGTIQGLFFIKIPPNRPPDIPSTPYPEDGAIEVEPNPELSWTGGDPDADDTMAYDVYFGMDNPPSTLVSHDQTETIFAPNTLEFSSTYHWKVIARDNHGAQIQGPVWQFTTQADTDGDGLSDTIEASGCTDPEDTDTDDDGIPDGLEDKNHNKNVDPDETDPCKIDTDDDGIQDGTELGYTLDMISDDTDQTLFIQDQDPSTTTNPLDNNSDGDNLLDGDEDANKNGRLDLGETDSGKKQFILTISAAHSGSTDQDGSNLIDFDLHPTITPTADPGYKFSGWTGDHVGMENPLIIQDLERDTAITAVFEVHHLPPVIENGEKVNITMSEDETPDAFELSLNATDINKEIITWSIKIQAEHGTASAIGSGDSKSIGYKPDANFHGLDTFSVQASDSSGLSDTITIKIVVQPINDLPMITQGDSISKVMSEDGSPVAFELALNATDADDDTLTWSVKTQANHGSASVSGTGSSTSITYLPVKNYNGNDSFVIQVSDGVADYVDTIMVNVTIESISDLTGDLNGDFKITFDDVAIALKVLINKESAVRQGYIHSEVDVNGDNKIGPEELSYIMEQLNQP